MQNKEKHLLNQDIIGFGGAWRSFFWGTAFVPSETAYANLIFDKMELFDMGIIVISKFNFFLLKYFQYPIVAEFFHLFVSGDADHQSGKPIVGRSEPSTCKNNMKAGCSGSSPLAKDHHC